MNYVLFRPNLDVFIDLSGLPDPDTKLTVVMWCQIFDRKSTVPSRQLRRPRPDFGTRLPEGFFYTLPPCVQADKEGWVHFIKSELYLKVFLITSFF